MHNFCVAPFLQGCGTGAGLIIAIGAQNAFVLKQGILKNHVLPTVLLCSVLDTLLISLGVGGFGQVLTSSAVLLAIARWGGVAFLAYYGFRAFRNVFKSESLAVEEGPERPNLKQSLIMGLVLTLLNPHAYLDAVVILGSVGAQFPSFERFYFGAGAILASFIWFFTIGYGARFLAPLFKKPIAWKILDFLVGCVMWGIALSLAFWSPTCACPN